MIATTTTTATMIIIFLFASGPSKIAIALSLSGVLFGTGRIMMIVKALSEAVRIKKPRSETSVLRRIWRPAFHGLVRGIIVGALGDTHTPAIPIR